MIETRWRRDRVPWESSGELSERVWSRVLALWSFAPVPFFRAFDSEEEMRLARVEDHLRTAE